MAFHLPTVAMWSRPPYRSLFGCLPSTRKHTFALVTTSVSAPMRLAASFSALPSRIRYRAPKVLSWGDGTDGQLGVGEEPDLVVKEPEEVVLDPQLPSSQVPLSVHASDFFSIIRYGELKRPSSSFATNQKGLDASRRKRGNTAGGGGGAVHSIKVPAHDDLAPKGESDDVAASYECDPRESSSLTGSHTQMFGCGNAEYFQYGCRDNQHVPMPLPSFTNRDALDLSAASAYVTGASCGRFHTLLRCANGSLYSLGGGNSGQLGHPGSIASLRQPTLVAALEKVNIVKAQGGWIHSMALSDRGQLYTWGSSMYFQLGNGSDFTCVEPVLLEFPSKKKVTNIAASLYHSIAVVDESEVWAWGSNMKGQLGNGGKSSMGLRPTHVQGVRTDKDDSIVDVACGLAHTVVVTRQGKVYSWGDNEYGQLGLGTDMACVRAPGEVRFERDDGLERHVYRVTSGAHHNIALAWTERGQEVWVWGLNSDFQLGLSDSRETRSKPVLVEPLWKEAGDRPVVLDVSAGRTHSLAIVGQLLCNDE